ncbi:MAG TPA: hypothetical protein VLS52_04645, partial [Rudaea sp.]|nr:hypothetical protein [Rudaea sp.]
MKPLSLSLAACIVLSACSPQYRNGAVRPTVPETLAGAHADAHAKATAKTDNQSSTAPAAATPDDPYLWPEDTHGE